MPSQFVPGKVIDGRFEILRELGSGFFGQVFLAKDLSLEREVAIKILNKFFENDSQSTNFQRFRREALVLSKLNHKNIASVFNFSETEDGEYYLVMEYLVGQSLADLLKSGRGLPLMQGLKLAQQVAQAMDYAHKAGVIHRDLKPENVFLAQTEADICAKVIDFGLCREFKIEGNFDQKTSTLTETGLVLGTPTYMSPEQCVGERSDERTDIYAFGSILYTIIAGSPPLIGETTMDTIFMHISQDVPRLLPQSPNSGLPPALDDLIQRCCHREREKRWQSFEQVLQELEELVSLNINCRFITEERKTSRSLLHEVRWQFVKNLTCNFLTALLLLTSITILALVFTPAGRVYIGELLVQQEDKGNFDKPLTKYLNFLAFSSGLEESIRVSKEIANHSFVLSLSSKSRLKVLNSLRNYLAGAGAKEAADCLALDELNLVMSSAIDCYRHGKNLEDNDRKSLKDIFSYIGNTKLSAPNKTVLKQVLDCPVKAGPEEGKRESFIKAKQIPAIKEIMRSSTNKH